MTDLNLVGRRTIEANKPSVNLLRHKKVTATISNLIQRK